MISIILLVSLIAFPCFECMVALLKIFVNHLFYFFWSKNSLYSLLHFLLHSQNIVNAQSFFPDRKLDLARDAARFYEGEAVRPDVVTNSSKTILKSFKALLYPAHKLPVYYVS